MMTINLIVYSNKNIYKFIERYLKLYIKNLTLINIWR